MKRLFILISFAFAMSCCVFADDPQAEEKNAEEKPLSRPALSDIFAPFEQWLATLNVSSETQNNINQYRQRVSLDMDEGEILELLTAMTIAADVRFTSFFDEQKLRERVYPLSQLTALTKVDSVTLWLGNVLNLQAARMLVNNGLYDDAAELLEGLDPAKSPCPATTLFYQGLVKYHSLDKQAAVPVLKRLVAMESIPKRYRELGERMILDIEGLEPKSLDHISRRMGDVAGRLDLGRANEKTVEIEDGIVKDLDEQIEKLEKQLEQMMKRQQQSSSPSQSPNPPQSGQPLGGPSGKGHVDRKDVGSGSGWGDLPEKEREKDLQQIQENFPPHYRDIIEQYFKRMSETEN